MLFYQATPAHSRMPIPYVALTALAAIALATQLEARLGAQRAGADTRSALFGGWTINRESSSTGPSPDRAGARGRGGPPPGRMPGGGFGGRGGGFGGGGFGGRGGGRQVDAEAMEKRRALMQELMTPTVRWVIAGGDDGIIVFTDADGRTTRYVANDKKEKHQLLTGTIETQTKWVEGALRQEIALGDGVQATRTYALEGDQLVVETMIDGGRGPGGGGRRAPVRWEYDRDGVQ